MTIHRQTSIRPASARDERGFAIIIVMILLLIGLGLGAAAFAETLASNSQANRDQRYNRALQAADAGANTNLYQLNEVNLSTLNFNGGLSGVANLVDCLLPTGTGLSITSSVATVALNGVCPQLSNPTPPANEPTGAVPVGNHAYYSSVATPTVTSDEGAGASSTTGHTELGYKIYSYGWDDNGQQSNTSQYQIRKIEETVAPVDPFETVEATGNIATNGIMVLNGDMRADGNLTENAATIVALSVGGLINLGSVNVSAIDALNVLGSSGLINTSSIEYGSGKTLTKATTNLSLIPTPTQLSTPFSRPPITIASTAADCSPAANCTTLASTYPAYYNSSTDMFTDTTGTSTVTLPGGDYIFCGFDVEKAQVTATTSSALPVRIFIDSPTSTRCSSDTGDAGLGDFTAKDGISNTIGTTAANSVSGLTSQITSLGGSGGLTSLVSSLFNLLGSVTSLVDGLTGVTLTGSNLTSLTATTQLQIYDVGSSSDSAGAASPSTAVAIGTGSASPLSQAMFVYAPDSNVTMETNLFSGNIIGDNVNLVPANGAAMVVLQDLGLADSSLANSLGAFHVQSYEECSAPSWSTVQTTLAGPTTANLASGC